MMNNELIRKRDTYAELTVAIIPAFNLSEYWWMSDIHSDDHAEIDRYLSGVM
jgi:hypothetical protein